MLTDIRSKRVGVTAGYNLQDELDDVGIIYDRAPNDRELVAMLFARRSDYIYASEDIVAQILKRLNRSAQVRIFFPFTRMTYSSVLVENGAVSRISPIDLSRA